MFILGFNAIFSVLLIATCFSAQGLSSEALQETLGEALVERQSLYAGFTSRSSPKAEALTDEGLDLLFQDPSRRADLIDFHRRLREALEADASASCTKIRPDFSRRWLVLAETEVDIYNLIADRNYLQWARQSTEMALKCDVNNGRARRLKRSL